MSRVTSQAVPPSLLMEYQRLFRTTDLSDPLGRLISLNPTVRAGEGEAENSPNVRTARTAAQWLTDQWLPGAATSVRADFFAARKAEILAGSYPSTYWWTPAPTSDMTEYCAPIFQEVLTPENSSINPLYWDETRKPQRCAYQDVHHSYATPSPPGTEQNPAPGWKGSITAGIWRDQYHAQRRRYYTLPITVRRYTTHPVLLDLTAAIQATASTRGHRHWFTLALKVWPGLRGPEKGATFLYVTDDRYLTAIPPADLNGWSHSLSRRLIRPAMDYINVSWSNATTLTVRAATVPARGYYFARNDAVTVYHQIALTLAIAKAP